MPAPPGGTGDFRVVCNPPLQIRLLSALARATRHTARAEGRNGQTDRSSGFFGRLVACSLPEGC